MARSIRRIETRRTLGVRHRSRRAALRPRRRGPPIENRSRTRTRSRSRASRAIKGLSNTRSRTKGFSSCLTLKTIVPTHVRSFFGFTGRPAADEEMPVANEPSAMTEDLRLVVDTCCRLAWHAGLGSRGENSLLKNQQVSLQGSLGRRSSRSPGLCRGLAKYSRTSHCQQSRKANSLASADQSDRSKLVLSSKSECYPETIN